MENWFVSSKVEGLEMRGAILRLDRFQVAFELYQTDFTLRASEVLNDFKVFLDDKLVYSGRAVVGNSLSTGTASVCEVKLDEPGVQAGFEATSDGHNNYLTTYKTFFGRWQSQAKIRPEFKMAVLDLQSYLSDLKLYLEQVELSLPASSGPDRQKAEREVSEELARPILAAIDDLRERFLVAVGRIEPEMVSVYRAFVQGQLHPLFLCAPFANRTYQKPLGYAGDYEMMNMIHRNTFEGESLYARILHYWLVNQSPARSVRNRVTHMRAKLVEEATRVQRHQRPARVLNLGCGPAREVQDFLSDHDESELTEITLVDFDAETLQYAVTAIEQAKTRRRRRTPVETRRMSVAQLIKDSAQRSRNPLGGGFDLVYCGGLFDYFSDRMCKQLVGLFYECLAPGGLVVVANMDDRVEFRQMMEFLLDWNLVYRDPKCMAGFVPGESPRENWSVFSEPLTVNLFLEVRKPPQPA